MQKTANTAKHHKVKWWSAKMLLPMLNVVSMLRNIWPDLAPPAGCVDNLSYMV